MNALTEETLVWLAALTVVAILVVARRLVRRKRSLKTTRTTDPVKSCIYNPREFRSPRNQSAGADRSSSGASAHDRLVQALKGDERRAARLHVALILEANALPVHALLGYLSVMRQISRAFSSCAFTRVTAHFF